MTEAQQSVKLLWLWRKWWLVVVVAVVLALASFWGVSSYQAHQRALREAYERAQPEYVLRVLDYLAQDHSADFEKYSGYFTPNGHDIYFWAQSQVGGFNFSNKQTVYSAPVLKGDGRICDIAAKSGRISYSVRLVKKEQWQFDDIYLFSIDGTDVKHWASYVKYVREHPPMVAKGQSSPTPSQGFYERNKKAIDDGIITTSFMALGVIIKKIIESQ